MFQGYAHRVRKCIWGVSRLVKVSRTWQADQKTCVLTEANLISHIGWASLKTGTSFTHNCNMSKINFTFQEWICSLRAHKGHMQSHTACSWGCKIWRSVAETQRPLPAPEVSNTPQGYSFLRFFEIWCAWWSFVFLQLNNARYRSCFYMLCLALRLGGGCDISGQLSRGPFQIMLHCAALQWMTLLLPCNSTRRGQNNAKHRTPGVWKESGKNITSQSYHISNSKNKVKNHTHPVQAAQARELGEYHRSGTLKKMSKTLQRTHGRKESHLRGVDTDNAVCVENSILFLFSFLRSLFRCQLTWECFHSTFDSPLWNIYICFNFVCLMLQLIYNHNAIFSLSCPLHQVPMADAIGTTWLWVHHHGRRWNRRQASQVQMRGQLAGYTMKARLDGRAESGKLQTWRKSSCARNTHKKLCQNQCRNMFFPSKAYWRCFTVYRQSEQLESFNLQIAIAYISYVGINELSELELAFFLLPGPCFWLWCQMDGSWGAGKQPQTWFKHHSSWVLWNIIVNLFI